MPRTTSALRSLGVGRCTALPAELTGLDVTDGDVRMLIEHAHIRQSTCASVGRCTTWRRSNTWAPTTDGHMLVAATIADRQAWLDAWSPLSGPPNRWAGIPQTCNRATRSFATHPGSDLSSPPRLSQQ